MSKFTEVRNNALDFSAGLRSFIKALIMDVEDMVIKCLTDKRTKGGNYPLLYLGRSELTPIQVVELQHFLYCHLGAINLKVLDKGKPEDDELIKQSIKELVDMLAEIAKIAPKYFENNKLPQPKEGVGEWFGSK
jgi:hypothetical protein